MDNKTVKIILTILIPPLGAFLQVGATKYFWTNIVLLFLTFGIGSLIHALSLVLTDQKKVSPRIR